MRLLVVRHGIAAPRESFEGPDAERPLTDRGRRRMVRTARALREEAPDVERIASSPLRRAVQTAELLSDAYGGTEIEEIPQLEPGADVRDLGGWLAARGAGSVAVVGHEPDLSAAVCWLAAGCEDAFLALGKGGAALLEFSGAVEAGRASLEWLLRPGQLRRLG